MANWWTLKVITGPDAGKVFTLNEDRTVIGRAKGDLILSADSELSSIHAEITYDPEKKVLILHDLRSRNGSRVNGEKVEKRALMPGDKLRFGVTELVLEPPQTEATKVSMSADAPPPPPPPEAEKKASSEKPAVAAAKSAEDGADEKKKKFDGKAVRRERPVAEESYEPSAPTVFYGFFSRFFGVLFHPTRFLEFLTNENAIIDGERAFNSALKFGAITWVGGGIFSTILTYYVQFVWKVGTPGGDHASNPFAIAAATFVGLFAFPLIALVYHWACHLLGGKGPFKVAVRIVCYISAVLFVKDLAALVPKAGPVLTIALQCYALYILSVAAIRMYYISVNAAMTSCAVSVALTIAAMVSLQRSTIRMQDELVRFNPVLSKSIGASIVVNGSNQPAPAAVPAPTSTDSVQPLTPEQQVAGEGVTPAHDEIKAHDAEKQRDPAANAPATAPPDDGAAKSPPPSTPPSNNANGGDPEMPTLPKTVE